MSVKNGSSLRSTTSKIIKIERNDKIKEELLDDSYSEVKPQILSDEQQQTARLQKVCNICFNLFVGIRDGNSDVMSSSSKLKVILPNIVSIQLYLILLISVKKINSKYKCW